MTTHFFRRNCTLLATLAALVLPAAGGLQSNANAQSPYPARSIHMAVPFPPGGVSDAAARLVAEQLSKRLGQQVVVENRPGASGNVSGQHVAAAEPDGYTIMLAYNGLMTINPFVFTKMPFDTVKDLTPIGKIGDYPTLITVNPAVDVKNLQDVIALSKTKCAALALAARCPDHSRKRRSGRRRHVLDRAGRSRQDAQGRRRPPQRRTERIAGDARAPRIPSTRLARILRTDGGV